MIDRTFFDLKFKRTYIGGSKKREDEIFLEVQGDPGKEYEDCDWIGFRNATIQKYDDYLNVIFTWRYLFKNISYGFAILCLILMLFKIYHALSSGFFWVIGSCLFISLVFQGIYFYFLHKQKQEIRNYDFSLSIIHGEIERKSGLKLHKNP